MTIATYSDLQTAVTNWLHRADLASAIPDFITLGEARVYRYLRVRQMETAISTTLSSGVYAVPTDYVEMKFLYISSTPNSVLDKKTAEWIYRNDPNRSSGKPVYFAREGTNFIFAPYPDSSYAISGIYYKRLSSVSSAVNTIFTSHPGLWLFSALCEAAPYIQNDPRIQIWEQKFQALIAEVNREEDRENASGSRLGMTADGISVS